MKILLIISGVPGGNTDRLTDAFAEGAHEAGHEVEKIQLNRQDIRDCQGCGACQRNGNRCAIQDDMQAIYAKFLACDALAMASPLYFWSISGRLKCFIDRLYAISVKDEYPEKKTVLLMTSGDDQSWTFDGALAYYHTFTRIFGGHDLGTCLAGGCTGCEESERMMPGGALERARQFGASLR